MQILHMRNPSIQLSEAVNHLSSLILMRRSQKSQWIDMIKNCVIVPFAQWCHPSFPALSRSFSIASSAFSNPLKRAAVSLIIII